MKKIVSTTERRPSTTRQERVVALAPENRLSELAPLTGKEISRLILTPGLPSPILGINTITSLPKALEEIRVSTVVLTGKITEQEFISISSWVQLNTHPTWEQLIIEEAAFDPKTAKIQKELQAIHTQRPFRYVFKLPDGSEYSHNIKPPKK